MLRCGVGSGTHCIYSKRAKKAEVYNERFALRPYNYTKCTTAGLASSGFHNSMLTTINISVCYIIVLEASISIIPHISLVGTCINIISMFICRYLTDNSMYSQLLVIFGLMSVTTTVFGFVANKLLHEQKMELNDYANTIDQILHMFA